MFHAPAHSFPSLRSSVLAQYGFFQNLVLLRSLFVSSGYCFADGGSRLLRRPHMRCRPLLLPFWGFPLVALFILLWSATAAASDLHPIRHAEGRLWRIERSGAPPSHIMGTIHIADPREIGRAHV